MPFREFDRSRLRLQPLSKRVHDLDLSSVIPLSQARSDFHHPDLGVLAEAILGAKKRGAAVILSMGAHLIRAGNSLLIIDLMERGLITHVAMNGAGPIHDFEFALIGATTESVERYIRTGEFGLWEETGRINEAVARGAGDGLGMGESIGRLIEEQRLPHRQCSILAAGYRLRVPVTVHVGIGYDIIHQHPNCDGSAVGAASYRDFLIMAESVSHLEGGVFLNFGSAVMGPEVYLKALSMARNVAHQEGREIRHFTTAVFDLQPLRNTQIEPSKSDPHYYFRPWKTILVRTVKDGGRSFYFCGDHRSTFPALYREILQRL